MNFRTMSRQRRYILLFTAAGFISMFLPWIYIDLFGFHQIVNGLHDKGIAVLICFITVGIIVFAGNQKEGLEKGKWTIIVVCAFLAILLMLWYFSKAAKTVMGISVIGYGFYLAALSSLGVLLSAYIFPSRRNTRNAASDAVDKNFTGSGTELNQ